MKKKLAVEVTAEQKKLRGQINSDYLNNKLVKFPYSCDEKNLKLLYTKLTIENRDLGSLVNDASMLSIKNKLILYVKSNPVIHYSKSKIKTLVGFKKEQPKVVIKAYKKLELAKYYNHNQPKLKPTSPRDFKKLRVNTLRAMKKKEKDQILNEKNSTKKQVFQEIYNSKWNDYIQFNNEGNIIDLKNVCKDFVNGTNIERILKNLNISIKTGEIFVILGASGSGKTTLLNTISGLMDASSGDVIVRNKNLFLMDEKDKIKFRADNISFVFQSYNLIPSLTVEENIKVGSSLRSKNSEKLLLKDILKLLKLDDQKNKYPFQLSGGQNQRVSIGRALAKNPKILFADEPTGALDEERGKEALKFLVDINKKYGTTIIMVTHNPNFKWVGDTTLKIHDGEIESLTHNKKRINPKDIKWT